MINKKNPIPKNYEEAYLVLSYPIISKTTLPKINIDPQNDFFEVLLKRRSKRVFTKLSLNDLGQVLWYSAKVMDVEITKSGFLWTHRPTPSAGGRHPIDILIIPPSKRKPSILIYNPLDHSLGKLKVNDSHLQGFIEQTNEILPASDATALWFLAHPERTSSKYENFESLIWRDAGALLFIIQLVCQALKINCCPLGSLGEPFLSNLFKERFTFGVGGCLIG